MGCNVSNSNNKILDEVDLYLIDNYEEYQIFDQSNELRLESQYVQFTDEFKGIDLLNKEDRLTLDFNRDEKDDFVLTIYKTEEIEDDKYTHRLFMNSIILISDTLNGFSSIQLSERITVYGNGYTIKDPVGYGIIEVGEYQRSGIVNDLINVEYISIGFYTPFSASILFWENNEIISIKMHISNE